MARFQKDFLLGAATAAHQVEGNNTNSDCWALELLPGSDYAEPSADAADHYHRYREDIRLMAQAGLNAYRFSIEWARIEPEEGHFALEEVEHYRDVIRCCRENGLEPIVTLHHFSSPKWLVADGGWDSPTVTPRFARYAGFIAQTLGAELHYICTINEANMRMELMSIVQSIIRSMMAKMGGGGESGAQIGMNLEQLAAGNPQTNAAKIAAFGTDQIHPFLAPCGEEGDRLILEAHQAAKAAIQERCPHIRVGLTLSLHDIRTVPGGEENAEKEWDMEFRHYLPWIQDDDFLGVQNYTHSTFGAAGVLPAPEGAELTQMGYEYDPGALEQVLRRVAKEFHGAILVTENGIATDNDARRAAFIDEATKGVSRCIADGLNIQGYLHWSLLDNFEWQKGYAMTFGLVSVDRKNNHTRIPKPSLEFLGSLR